jgi:hypothetical protein
MSNGLQLFYPVKPFTYPITQHFGENPQWYPLTKGHNGIDWGIPLRTSIFATLPGTIIRVASDPNGYGNHIRISHGDGLVSLYGHMDAHHYTSLEVGDEVKAGQFIGYSGNTGRSTGPHLHFEVRRGNVAFDPEPYLTATIPGTDTEIEPPEAIFKARVLDDINVLNVRSGPGTLYPIIGKMSGGDEVEVLSIDGKEIWLQTPKGYIAMRYDGDDLAELLSKDE